MVMPRDALCDLPRILGATEKLALVRWRRHQKSDDDRRDDNQHNGQK